MKWRDILKGVVIGIFIAAMALNLGRCTREAAAVNISSHTSIRLCTTVKDIQQGLVAEDAIKQSLKDNYEAFIRMAKTTRYGQSIILHTSIEDNNLLYTMSIRGNQQGIVSIDFIKQVTVSKSVVDIYYEGVKFDGYYCYAKQLLKAENCKQVKIPASSIFEQILVMLFEEGRAV